jgi:hypothetical protein
MNTYLKRFAVGLSLAIALLFQSCFFGGIKEMRIGQLQAIDKLPHEFEVNVRQPHSTGIFRQDFADGDEMSEADVTISIANLGKKLLIITPSSEGMESNQIQPGETRQVFIGKCGNLMPGFFMAPAGDEPLHYKLTLVFQKEQKLREPLRISLVWMPPSL